jgi:hypothetical protein
MRNDPKVKALRRKYQEGYMVFNMLLEVLTGSDFFTIDYSPIQVELLAGDFDVDPETLEQIVDYCVKVNLLVKEQNLIYSCGLRKRLQPVLDNRNAVKQRFLDKKLKNEDVSKVDNTQSKVKYSKVKETKIVVEEKGDYEEKILEQIEEILIPEIISDGLVNEEEKIAAVNFLKNHSMFALIQKQQTLKPPEVIKLFETFYETKSVLKEITGKSKDEVLKHFLFWVPKYKQSTQPSNTSKPANNGNANYHTRRNNSVAASADEKRAERGQLVDSLRGLLRGTEPKE